MLITPFIQGEVYVFSAGLLSPRFWTEDTSKSKRREPNLVGEAGKPKAYF